VKYEFFYVCRACQKEDHAACKGGETDRYSRDYYPCQCKCRREEIK